MRIFNIKRTTGWCRLSIVHSALCIAMLTACSDFLDPEMTDSINQKTFYSTESQIDQAMNGIYHLTLDIARYRWIMSEERSDNVWIEQDKSGGVYDIAYFKNSSLVSSSHVLNTWKTLYAIVANANVVLEKIDAVNFTDEAIKNHYKGELRFLRALAYFDLVRYFGNIPVSTQALTPEEGYTIHQSDAKSVYEQVIVPDLLYASENLLEVAKRYDGKTEQALGRPTQMAAKALLAEVYVTMSGYPVMDSSKKELAKTLLKEVIDYSEANDNKWWASDMTAWNSMWLHENNNKFFIFEIQCATDESYSVGNPVTPMTVDRWSGSYYGGTKNQLAGASYGYPYVEPSLRKYLMTTNSSGDYIDKRCFHTITVKDDNGKTITTNEFYYMKFWENKVKREALGYSDIATSLPDKSTIWPQDFPIIRLENIILYYAELLGKSADGLKYLNKTRVRAGLTAYKLSDFSTDDAYLQAVLDERRIELAAEGHRWFDLVRLNIWQETMKSMFTTDGPDSALPTSVEFAENVLPYTYLFPIPLQQLQLRDGLYNQNKGY